MLVMTPISVPAIFCDATVRKAVAAVLADVGQPESRNAERRFLGQLLGQPSWSTIVFPSCVRWPTGALM